MADRGHRPGGRRTASSTARSTPSVARGCSTPNGGRLVVVYPTTEDSAARVDIGEAHGADATRRIARDGHVRLAAARGAVGRDAHPAAAGGRWPSALLVLVSITAGTVVAVVTARRLADPLRDVADRAARLAEGDFRPDPRRHDIAELDRVSDVLDSATVEIAGRLQREHALVADVSHQLRSRLTAVRLRLDELSVHADPDGRGRGRGGDGAGGPADRRDRRPGPRVARRDAADRDPVSVIGELQRGRRGLAAPVRRRPAASSLLRGDERCMAADHRFAAA